MEIKKIHIGTFVKETIKSNGDTLISVANKAGWSKQKLNGFFKKDDWQVKDLFTISQAAGYDFLKHFCQPTGDAQETKVVLHIEVEKAKTAEVLKLIKDKQLYNILKD